MNIPTEADNEWGLTDFYNMSLNIAKKLKTIYNCRGYCISANKEVIETMLKKQC